MSAFKPKQLSEIEQVFKKYGLEDHYDSIKSNIRNRIDVTLEPLDDSKIEIGRTKIGGKPDLNSVEWPKTDLDASMSFIGQLNCEELKRYDLEGLLPETGLISFFYCAEQSVWGFDPNDKSRFKVLYNDNLNDISRKDFPDDLPAESRFLPNVLFFDTSLSLQDLDVDFFDELILNGQAQNYINAFSNFSDSENQILGHASPYQNPMEIECQLVNNGINIGDGGWKNDPRFNELEKGKNDWILLLQIDSDEEKTGMHWAMSGRIYFWIRKQDLKIRNFDNCWFILQST